MAKKDITEQRSTKKSKMKERKKYPYKKTRKILK